MDVRLEGETVWLSLNQLASLFQRDKSVISRHIKNVFDEGELHAQGTVATRFRIWATQRLREYIVKGFVLDDERLKNPDVPFDYFDELTRRIQDIRTSERRFYQKITDIYATSVDYDPTQEISITFFKTVQNKVHWAITGQTAAEIVHGPVDADFEAAVKALPKARVAPRPKGGTHVTTQGEKTITPPGYRSP